MLALFIISTLASGHFPSAYQTKSTATVGERHEKEASLPRMADDDLTSLSAGMIWVRVDSGQRILKHGDSLREGHPVLPVVGRGFGRIPLEGRGIHGCRLVYQPRPLRPRLATVGRTPAISCEGRDLPGPLTMTDVRTS